MAFKRVIIRRVGPLSWLLGADESKAIFFMNRWNIPDWLEREVTARDKSCVYCGASFNSSKGQPKTRSSWEHIINDATIINRENIAKCCVSCNSSKGAKELLEWLTSEYCKSRGISQDTVAPVVRNAIFTKLALTSSSA